ncbi:MAG TPA: hypothetical protein VJN22_05290, partial [Candidatus Eremiobacteraceae bacterium]|nr:hypothetical protein [Candidatus Eremiobacteraceae bacterium]
MISKERRQPALSLMDTVLDSMVVEAPAASAKNRTTMPEFVRPSNEDEMVLEFIKAESASSAWVDNYKFPDGFSYEELITNANLQDDHQNQVRRSMLNYRGYTTRTAVFAGFPLDVEWAVYR